MESINVCVRSAFQQRQGLLALVLFVVAGCSGLNGEQSAQLLSALPSRQAQATPKAVLSALEKSRNNQVALQANALFANLVGQQQFSGSVLIARGGQVLLDKGYGMANWQTSTPNTPQTRFYLGSVTKEFTAMAILMLQQRGKLDVQKSICTYITPCPSAWQAVTLHDLLTHTSGIPELGTDQFEDESLASWIASYDNVGLNFTPGSQFDYCSVCYEILAYVVQQVAGIPYSQFMQQEIFTPLHMDHTGFSSDTFYASPDHATGYASWQSLSDDLGYGDTSQFSDLGPWSFLTGSGLLTSTVGDLYL